VWFLHFAIRLLSDPKWSTRRHSPARRTSKCARISRNLQHTLQREGTTQTQWPRYNCDGQAKPCGLECQLGNNVA